MDPLQYRPESAVLAPGLIVTSVSKVKRAGTDETRSSSSRSSYSFESRFLPSIETRTVQNEWGRIADQRLVATNRERSTNPGAVFIELEVQIDTVDPIIRRRVRVAICRYGFFRIRCAHRRSSLGVQRQ
jgi:hypothetical protein